MQLKYDTQSFKIYLDNDILWASHSHSQPLLKVTSGDEFEENNYPDKDVFYAHRLDLTYFRIIRQDSDGWAIGLSHQSSFEEEVQLFYHKTQQARLEFESHYRANQFDRFWLRLHATKAEFLYGGGQHGYQFNLKGYTHALFLQDEVISKGKRIMPLRLVRQPAFVSSRGYALVVEGTERITMDALASDAIYLEIWGKLEALVFFIGNNMLDIVQKQSHYLGRVHKIPSWIGREAIAGFRGPVKRMQHGLTQLAGMGFTLGGLWFQDWAHATFPTFGDHFVWNWICAQSLIASLTPKVQLMYENGIRAIAYLNGLLAEGSQLFNEADSLDYLVCTRTTETYFYQWQEFNLAFVDLTNPEAFDWFVGVIGKYMLGIGFKAWLIDDGAQLPVDALLHNGTKSSELRHLWPVLLAKACHQAVVEADALNEVVILSTSGWSGSSKYMHGLMMVREYIMMQPMWSLKPTVVAILSGSMSGYGLQGSVIGNYTGQPASPELIIRHGELVTFTTLFWLQEADDIYQIYPFYEDSSTMAHLSRLASLFNDLRSYRDDLARSYVSTGSPITAPLCVYYDQEHITYSIDDQFMLGTDILVAPILHAGQMRRNVYFPSGIWYHFSSDLVVEGPMWQEVSAPLGYPVAFYKEGAMQFALFNESAYHFKDALHRAFISLMC